jgi:SAM-dependent methyltransferase
MSDHESDAVFAESVPDVYERYLVPLIFEWYAADLVDRMRRVSPGVVLEVAAGTGVVTRAMAAGLDESVAITGTDLSPAMIDYARAVGTRRPVAWRQADVMDLPFDDGSFDVVVCQFSAMFFPDKGGGFAEIERVLRPGGTFVFNVWDSIEHNEFAEVVTAAVGELFPDDPPRFLARTPHGYHDEAVIRADLASGGFDAPVEFEALEHRSLAATSDIPAIAYCQGTPLRNEIEARDASRLGEATTHAATRLAERFGATDLDGKIRGIVVTATT